MGRALGTPNQEGSEGGRKVWFLRRLAGSARGRDAEKSGILSVCWTGCRQLGNFFYPRRPEANASRSLTVERANRRLSPLLLRLALRISLRNLLRVNQSQRHRLRLPRLHRHILFPLAEHSRARSPQIVILRPQFRDPT